MTFLKLVSTCTTVWPVDCITYTLPNFICTYHSFFTYTLPFLIPSKFCVSVYDITIHYHKIHFLMCVLNPCLCVQHDEHWVPFCNTHLKSVSPRMTWTIYYYKFLFLFCTLNTCLRVQHEQVPFCIPPLKTMSPCTT